MKFLLDYLFIPAILGAAFFGLWIVIALLNGSSSFLFESLVFFVPCIAIILLDHLIPDKAHSKALHAPQLTVEPKLSTKPQAADLSHLKDGILKSAEASPLGYSRLMAILDNKHRFGFSEDEIKMLEESQVIGPFPEAPTKPTQVCSRCGGSGYIDRYRNYEGGRCFKCNSG